ncbi:hypothetical protein GYMLUDRAFT_260673 [Collybiopsis luxurians FD-317 M1]|uniref:Uncharacterized protein n=1 Tax=Collybiopsis luxurians FD-317 M1 TaxID=944289 RepID=A0A0D0CR52_9AGAR|nr:hypothetical protein GYMLUDRAFT_260673 [Collybiopsis luxurians FD-317 M1]
MILHFSLVLLFSAIFHITFALKNVTIPHNSSSVLYKPTSNAWNASDSALDYSKSHVVTNVKGASASLIFTGIAVYYMAASWPYPVSVKVALDGDSGTFVDLRDYGSTQSDGGSASADASMRWSRTGLKNATHTVVVSLPSNATYAVMDTLIYTVDDGDGDNGNNNDSSNSSTTWPIILGSVLGGVVLLGAVVGVFLVYRCRQKRKAQGPIWDTPVLENATAPALETAPLVSSYVDTSESSRRPADSTMMLGYFSGSGSGSNNVGASEVGAGRYMDEKKPRPEVVLSVANPESEEALPPAYTPSMHLHD